MAHRPASCIGVYVSAWTRPASSRAPETAKVASRAIVVVENGDGDDGFGCWMTIPTPELPSYPKLRPEGSDGAGGRGLELQITQPVDSRRWYELMDD